MSSHYSVRKQGPRNWGIYDGQRLIEGGFFARQAAVDHLDNNYMAYNEMDRASQGDARVTHEDTDDGSMGSVDGDHLNQNESRGRGITSL